MRQCLFWLGCAVGVIASTSAFAGDAVDAASFSPVPQISLSVPEGWIVCDELTGQKTSNAVPPSILEKDSCKANASANGKFILKSTVPNAPALVFLFVKTDAEFTRKFFERLSPAYLPKFQKALCDKSAALIEYTSDSCVVAPGILAGETVLLGEAIGTLNGRQTKTHVRIVDLAYSGGMVLMILAGAADRPQPAVDAILKSITVN